MKRYSKVELQEAAKPHFEKLKVNKLYATTDGQFFLLENRANLHAKSSLTVYKLENEEQAAPQGENTTEKQPTVKELLEQLERIDDLETLNDMLLTEIAGQNRSTAVKSIEAKIAHLTK